MNLIMGFRVEAVIEAENLLAALEAVETPEEMLALMSDVSYEAFRVLDEKPGLVDSKYQTKSWPRLLRTVRNDSSNDLFDRLVR